MASVPISRTDVEAVLGAAQVGHILGVHARTVQRRRTAARKPTPLEAQRREKLHRIWKHLLDLYTPEHALQWLRSSVPALDDRHPLDIMAEDGGLDRVLDTVVRMSWGIPA